MNPTSTDTRDDENSVSPIHRNQELHLQTMNKSYATLPNQENLSENQNHNKNIQRSIYSKIPTIFLLVLIILSILIALFIEQKRYTQNITIKQATSQTSATIPTTTDIYPGQIKDSIGGFNTQNKNVNAYQRKQIKENKKQLKVQNNVLVDNNKIKDRLISQQAIISSKKDQNILQKQKGVQQLQEVSVVITSSGRYDLLSKVMDSFYQHNTYPNINFIIVEDGPQNPQLDQMKKKYPHIKWIVSGVKIGQIAATDLAYKHVTTQFYVHGQNDFIYLKKGFIEAALKIMKKDQSIACVPFMPYMRYESLTCNILDQIYCGFTFNPSMHRMSHYKLIKGGYVGLTSNATFGYGAGAAQQRLSYYYMRKSYQTVCLLQAFIIHIGDKRGSPKPKSPHQLLKKDKNSLSERDKKLYEYTKALSQLRFWQFNAKIQARNYFHNGFKIEKDFDLHFRDFSLTQLGVDKQVQVGSKLNYLNLEQSQFYQHYLANFTKIMDFLQLDIEANAKTANKQKVGNPFRSYQQLQQHFDDRSGNSIEFNIAKQVLAKNHAITTAGQYHFYKKKYNLDSITQQNKICLVIEGKIFNFRQNYFKNLVNSIKSQNYTNIKTVFISQIEPKNLKNKINQYRLNQYVKQIVAVKNVWKLENTGNFHVIKKYCPRNSIVVMLQNTDELIGKNALQVINAVYINPKLMYATFRSLQRISNINIPEPQNLDKSIIQNFRTQNNIPVAPFLKTFRHSFSRVDILQQTTQLVLNYQTKVWHPRFYQTSSDIFQTYSLIQLAGPKQLQFFDDFLLYRPKQQLNKECQKQKDEYTQIKASLKTPLKVLNSLLDPIQKRQNYEIPNEIIQKLRQKYNLYQTCLHKQSI